jgi:hypothetical protein
LCTRKIAISRALILPVREATTFQYLGRFSSFMAQSIAYEPDQKLILAQFKFLLLTVAEKFLAKVGILFLHSQLKLSFSWKLLRATVCNFLPPRNEIYSNYAEWNYYPCTSFLPKRPSVQLSPGLLQTHLKKLLPDTWKTYNSS